MSDFGRLVVSAAGAYVGFMIGGPTGAQIGWMAGSWLGAGLFSKTQKIQGPMLSDLRVTGTEYGQDIPWVIGHPRIAGQIWWASKKRPIPHTETQEAGKGGGGDSVETTTYTYEVDLLIGLTNCRLVDVTRIWWNGKVVYNRLSVAAQAELANVTPDAGFIARALANAFNSQNTAKWKRMTFYTGHPDQAPDPTYEAAIGIGKAPAYIERGTIFFEGLDLGSSGAIPNLTFEVATKGVPETLLIEDFYTLPSESWALNGLAENKVVPTDIGARMWFTMPPNYDNGWFQGGQRVGLFDHATQSWVYISDDLNRPFLLVSSGITHAGRVWAVWETGSGLTQAGACMVFHQDGTWNDVGAPEAFLNSSGAHGVSDILEARASSGDNLELQVKIFYIRQRGAGGTLSLRYSRFLDPRNDSGSWAGAGLDLGTAGNAGFNSRFLTGGNRIFDRIYFFTWGNIAGLAWVNIVSNFVTVIRAGVDAGFFGAVGWDENLYCQDNTTGRSNWLVKLDKNGSLIGEIDMNAAAGLTSMTKVLVDKNNNVFIQGGPGATIFWVDGNTMTYKGSVALPAGQQMIGDHSYFGSGAFVAVDASPYNQIRLLSPPGQLLDETLFDAVTKYWRDVCGLTPGVHFNVNQLTNITKPVRGGAVGAAPGRQFTELLMSTHYWDIVLSDMIYGVPRGGAPVATIPYEDLGAHWEGEGEGKEPFELVFNNDLEIPTRISVTFINLLRDYATDTVESERIITEFSVEKTENIRIPMVMTPTEAKGLANTFLMDRIVARVGVDISVTGKYLKLEPTDPVNVIDKDGGSYRVRFVQREDSYPLLGFKAVFDDPSILKHEGITSLFYGSAIDVALPPDSLVLVLDAPQQRDADNYVGYYIVMKGSSSPWPGGGYYVSTDDAQYAEKVKVLESGIFGTTSTALGSWNEGKRMDWASSVIVNIGIGNTLSSSTRATLLANATVNRALIGGEIVQFVYATLISDGVYKLTGFLRGLNGTERAQNTHVAVENFVLLRTAGMRRVSQANSELGVSFYHRAVTLGRRVADATSAQSTNTGISLKPLRPTLPRVRRNLATDDLAITIDRRTRMATRVFGDLGKSIPLGEETESYKLDIYSDGTYTTLKRTLTSTNGSFTYLAADQATDGFTAPIPLGSFFAKAKQVSAIVGDGFELEIAS